MTLARRLARPLFLFLVLAGLLLTPAPGASALTPADCRTGFVTYAFTGGEQCYRVPDGVTRLSFEAAGGTGGAGLPASGMPGAPGGEGALITGELAVTPGQILVVVVGGNGQPGSEGSDAEGGYNGGGSHQQASEAPGSSGGGGGASDVRTVPCGSRCPGSDTSVESRLFVAGGGGGGGYDSASSGTVAGGAGGTPDGEDGQPLLSGGEGGTQTGPGGTGERGRGGSDLGGGGGGGVFGGGAGLPGPGGASFGGGGGGSSSGPAGTSYALDNTATPHVTISAPPTARTDPATNVQANSATLNGAVNPNGRPTSYSFQYGTSTAYGGSAKMPAVRGSATDGRAATTSSTPVGSGNALVAASANVTGLSPNTTYHFRVVARSPGGTAFGQDRTFRTDTTGSPQLEAVTDPATGTGCAVSTLRGRVDPNGTAARYRFDFRRVGSGTVRRSATRSAGSGDSPVAVQATVRDLRPATTYRFRVVAMNATQTVRGQARTLRTRACTITARTGPARDVHARRGTVTGTVNPRGAPARYRFQLGRTKRYGRSTRFRPAGSGDRTRRFAATFRRLRPGTLYHYRIVAVNSAGRVVGRDRTFRTPAAPRRTPRFTG